MNTITKDRIIEAAQDTSNVDTLIIIKYCEEKSKDADDIEDFINTLKFFPALLIEVYNIALLYYIEKFNIILIYDGTKLIKAY